MLKVWAKMNVIIFKLANDQFVSFVSVSRSACRYQHLAQSCYCMTPQSDKNLKVCEYKILSASNKWVGNKKNILKMPFSESCFSGSRQNVVLLDHYINVFLCFPSSIHFVLNMSLSTFKFTCVPQLLSKSRSIISANFTDREKNSNLHAGMMLMKGSTLSKMKMLITTVPPRVGTEEAY